MNQGQWSIVAVCKRTAAVAWSNFKGGTKKTTSTISCIPSKQLYFLKECTAWHDTYIFNKKVCWISAIDREEIVEGVIKKNHAELYVSSPSSDYMKYTEVYFVVLQGKKSCIGLFLRKKCYTGAHNFQHAFWKRWQLLYPIASELRYWHQQQQQNQCSSLD